jgi:hypothetical protein
MSDGETNGVDQAVFGYSNGHRLLSSTLPLSAIDVYELAAASDLAPGAQISGESSYLTGLPLPDSKLYALIRTWLAPEMSRPGCVWSHVLLLDHSFIATQIDLAALADLHRRPEGYATDSGFALSIPVNRRLRAGKGERKEIDRVLLACYADLELDEARENSGKLEQAILAVWSQQWPRLRRQFTFRSTSTTSELKGQSLRFKQSASAKVASPPPWLETAAIDAASPTVTALRRFLWRYGKDIDADRAVFPELVQIYVNTRSENLQYNVADEIFRRFPAGQADTLKDDVLGLLPNRLSQIPRLNSVDLLWLLAEHQALDAIGNVSGLPAAFARTDASDHVELAIALMASRERLEGRFDLIFGAVLPNLDASALEDERTPTEFALSVILERPELLTSSVVDRLSNADLKSLPTSRLTQKQCRDIVRKLMQRPFDRAFVELFLSQPDQTLRDGVALAAATQLHDSWFPMFRDNAPAFQKVVASLASGDELVGAVHLLAFPMDSSDLVRSWFVAFDRNRTALSRGDQAHLSVYLLALSVRHGMENFRDVLAGILGDLRQRILRNDLPRVAADWLFGILPYDDASWDLNKRLLKLFRKEYKRGRKFDEVLETLNLTDDDYAYATDQDSGGTGRGLWRIFAPR